jgi:hypothetical protein
MDALLLIGYLVGICLFIAIVSAFISLMVSHLRRSLNRDNKLPVFTGVDPLDFNELTPLFSRELTPSISLS